MLNTNFVPTRAVLLLFIALICFHEMGEAQGLTTLPDAIFLKKKLKQKKFGPQFIKEMMKVYEHDSFASVLKLNMLGFLNPPQHSVLVTDEGVIKSEEFIQAHKPIFIRVEKRECTVDNP